MEEVNVKTDELLTILKENRAKHVKEHKEAVRAFRVKAAAAFQKEFQKASTGKPFQTQVNLSRPDSHEKDYDLMIKMLEMSIDNETTLTQYEFTQLVNDEWGWTSGFQSAVRGAYRGYSGTSGSSGISGSSGSSGTSGFYILSEDEEAEEFIAVTFSEDED